MTRNVEESLRAIPTSQREGGLALGMSRWGNGNTSHFTSCCARNHYWVILSSGRVFGEAAA